MPTPGLDQVTATQTALEHNSLSFVAALFAVLFVSLLWIHLRSKDRQFREVMSLAIKVESALTGFASYVDTLPKPRHSRRRKSGPEEVTATFLAPPERPDDKPD